MDIQVPDPTSRRTLAVVDNYEQAQEMVDKLAERWLPKPRISHPWPSQRFRVKHPRWEPYAGMPHVRFCAGGAQ